MRFLLRAAFALLVLLVLIVGALVWRLGQGPISLALVQPLLQELVDRGSPYRTSFTDPMLVWMREDAAIGLAAHVADRKSTRLNSSH